jgi:hypothetical protein
MLQSSLLAFLSLVIIAAPAYPQNSAVEPEPTVPDLSVIVPSMEKVERQNPALTHPYEMIREYKAFGADDSHPISEVTAKISFVPPDKRTFAFTHVSGNAKGKKIVRTMLEQEAQPAASGHNGDISRPNYDFAFLRQENFGPVPEYVLHIVPKRKEKNLLLGQIWVDAKTLQIRRIEGVPAQNPSIWIKDIHITLQFGDVNGMWLPISLDAIATVHFSGRYTLTGLYVGSPKTTTTVDPLPSPK